MSYVVCDWAIPAAAVEFLAAAAIVRRRLKGRLSYRLARRWLLRAVSVFKDGLAGGAGRQEDSET
jgi:hypothetical protein